MSQSKQERFIQALLDDVHISDVEIISRIDAYLRACCLSLGSDGLPEPISRVDKLLFLLAAKLKNGTTSSGGEQQNGASLPNFLSGDMVALTEIDLAGVKKIRDAAFMYYHALLYADIPDDCTALGTACFSWCAKMTFADTGNGVTVIPVNCFNECRALETVELGENVVTIGEYAFLNAGADTVDGLIIKLHGVTPPKIAANALQGAKIKNIVVPAGCAAKYSGTANWSTYASYIVEG